MSSSLGRVNVTLDPARAAKLSRLAQRVHVAEGTLARSLLSTALDEADPDPAGVTGLLDRLEGAFERSEQGRAQAKRGEGIDISEL